MFVFTLEIYLVMCYIFCMVILHIFVLNTQIKGGNKVDTSRKN